MFYQLVEQLSALGEIEFQNLFVDGTKLEANANRYTFVWAKAVQKNLNKLYGGLIESFLKCFQIRLDPNVELEQAIHFLSEIASMRRIVFVSGKGKRKTELQRDWEKLSEYGNGRKSIKNASVCAAKEKATQKQIPTLLYAYERGSYAKRTVKARLQRSNRRGKWIYCRGRLFLILPILHTPTFS